MGVPPVRPGIRDMHSAGHKSVGGVLVISGPSGAGKSTVCRRLCERLRAEFSVSWTTRPARPGEVDGREYRFVAPDAFEKLARDGGFVEQAEVYGRRYGTPMQPILEALAAGRTVVLEIDINGAIQVRRRFPDAFMVFLLPPTAQEQARRLTGRQTDTAAEIQKRLSRADGEIRHAQESGVYDHFVVNDDVEATVGSICDRVEAARRSAAGSS